MHSLGDTLKSELVITLPEGLESIGEYSFQSTALRKWLFYPMLNILKEKRLMTVDVYSV